MNKTLKPCFPGALESYYCCCGYYYYYYYYYYYHFGCICLLPPLCRGIYTHVPETNHVSRVSSAAANL